MRPDGKNANGKNKLTQGAVLAAHWTLNIK
jgi:hypothetical protein